MFVRNVLIWALLDGMYVNTVINIYCDMQNTYLTMINAIRVSSVLF